MGEERLKVLEMLEKGTITSEEALKLLELLKAGEPEETAEQPETEEAEEKEEKEKTIFDDVEQVIGDVVDEAVDAAGKAKEKIEEEVKNHQFDYNWIHDLKDNIVESAINISRYVGTQTYNTFGFGRPNQFYSNTCENVEEMKALKIQGKNDRVEIVGHKENTIKIEARYKLKRDEELPIEFETEDGEYKLTYDYNAVHSMGLYIKVPDKQIQQLQIDNKNAEVVVKRVKAVKADLITKNACIEMDTMDCTDLSAETKNAPIHACDIFAAKISLKTSNGPISLKSANADFAKLITSNSAINLDSIDIREIYAKSSNAGMIFRNLRNMVSKEYPLYNLEAYTSCGDITVEIPDANEMPCKINAATSNGSIRSNMEDLEFLVESPDFVKAKSSKYDESACKLNLMLQTSNSNINIREDK